MLTNKNKKLFIVVIIIVTEDPEDTSYDILNSLEALNKAMK